MFVGRVKELQILKEELEKDSSSILLYGKRKIGKTTLINKACKDFGNKPFIYFECVKDTEEKNIQEIIKILKSFNLMSNLVSLPNDTFLDLFMYLDSLNQKMIVVIDEYPYLKEYTPSKTIDSVFQKFIDNNIKNINLIISGSHIGMMKDLLEEKNALFGRFNRIIELKEMSYLEASEFYPNKSNYDKVGFYSVFGGSPFVNEQIDASKDLKTNIIKLLFNNNHAIYHYASSLLISDLSNQNDANRILKAIGNGRKSYSELETILDKNKTGLLSKQLKPLLEMNLIKKEAPINKLNDAKKMRYAINDNLLRFYYTYVLPNQYLLNYKDPLMIFEEEIKPSLLTFVSLRFEDICKDFMWHYINTHQIKNIVNVGKYYYNNPVARTNGEFDVALLNKDNSVQIIEVKYLIDKVNQSMVYQELSQINQIQESKIDKVGFISINGFDNNIIGLDYMFDGDDIYHQTQNK